MTDLDTPKPAQSYFSLFASKFADQSYNLPYLTAASGLVAVLASLPLGAAGLVCTAGAGGIGGRVFESKKSVSNAIHMLTPVVGVAALLAFAPSDMAHNRAEKAVKAQFTAASKDCTNVAGANGQTMTTPDGKSIVCFSLDSKAPERSQIVFVRRSAPTVQ